MPFRMSVADSEGNHPELLEITTKEYFLHGCVILIATIGTGSADCFGDFKSN